MIRFITYSTPGEYREAAVKMIASADRVGVEIVHYEEPPFPRWRTALYHKAVVIERAMKEFPKYDICWIDADAEFRAHPTLLFNLPPHRKLAAYCEKLDGGRVLWGGTLWIKNEPETLKIVEQWKWENDNEGKGFIDDNNLLHAFMKTAPKTWLHILPPSYFWVPKYFPQRFPGGNPVIIQNCIGMGGNNVLKQKEAKYRPWYG